MNHTEKPSLLRTSTGRGFWPTSGGFTLIELLAVIAIVAILAAIIIPCVGTARSHARKSTEIQAARNLITAFHAYTAEHRGVFFNGNNLNETAYDLAGNTISAASPASARYPWRLLPYLGNSLEGGILVNESLEETKTSGSYDTYKVSLMPTLGMNVTYVGSDRQVKNKKGEVLGENPHSIMRMVEAVKPGELVVFASGGVSGGNQDGEDGDATYHGYWHVNAPYEAVSGAVWPLLADADFPVLGNVSLRWSGRAVVAHLDGNVRLLGESELRDMRRWSNEAAEANNPMWSGN